MAAWSLPELISEAAGIYYGIAVDHNGNATAVWTYYDGSIPKIQTAYKPSADTWQTAETLSSLSENSFMPQITFDANSNAMAVWVTVVGGTGTIQAAFKPFGDNWQTANTISPSGEFSVEPQIAFDPNGNATAMWTYYEGSNFTLKTAYKPSGANWQAAEAFLQSPSNSNFPQIAFDTNGNATAIWMNFDTSTNKFRIQTSHKPSGDNWQTVETISSPDELSEFPQLAVDSSGNAIAIWIELLSKPNRD